MCVNVNDLYLSSIRLILMNSAGDGRKRDELKRCLRYNAMAKKRINAWILTKLGSEVVQTA